MKKVVYILTAMLATNFIAIGQDIPIPDNYSIVDSVKGDLDKDNVKELVVAYNTESEEKIESIPRALIIYKLEHNQWREWRKSEQALY